MLVQAGPSPKERRQPQSSTRGVHGRVVGQKQTAPELAVVFFDSDVVLTQHRCQCCAIREFRHTVGGLGVVDRFAGQSGEANGARPCDDLRTQHLGKPVQLEQSCAIEIDRRRPPGREGRVEERRRAAQEEAAVAPRRAGRDPPGVDADNLQPTFDQGADRRETRPAEADDTHVGRDVLFQHRKTVPRRDHRIVVPGAHRIPLGVGSKIHHRIPYPSARDVPMSEEVDALREATTGQVYAALRATR